MKKIFLVLIITLCCSIMIVNAQEISYNNQAINLSEKEYNYIIELYGEQYLQKMTVEDYNWIKELNIDNSEVEIKTLNPKEFMPLGTIVSTSDEKIAISKICQKTYCIITSVATWLNSPVTRSYDVMGFRFYGTSLYNNNVVTRLSSKDGVETVSNYKYLENGFGNSIKLPESGNDILIEQRIYVKTGGTVYASYQHALKNVTLTTSKNYQISATGYGNVFVFTDSAEGVYNGLSGVYLSV